MTIEYKFSIGQKVWIKELEHIGVVLSVWSARRGNEIQVRYCLNSKFEEVYLFEHELEEVKDVSHG